MVYLRKIISQFFKSFINNINRIDKFSEKYIEDSGVAITLLSIIDEKLPRVTVIHQDEIYGNPVILGFSIPIETKSSNVFCLNPASLT